MCANATGFDNPNLNSGMTIAGRYDGHGFFVRKNNYLEKMPLFAASRYITYHGGWTERTRIMKSGDGYEKYNKALREKRIEQELLKCLLFNCLVMQNHCQSFYGRFYNNQMCLDTTNGETIATTDLKRLHKSEVANELLTQWENVLQSAKKTENYNPNINYGVYQIFTDLNTTHKDEKDGSTIYDYPELNGNLTTLKVLVKNIIKMKLLRFCLSMNF